MSNSPKNTMNASNPFEQDKSNVNTAASDSSNRTEKRSVVEDINVEVKKIKIETPTLERKVPMDSAAPPQFVSAATMVVPIPELTDEELLKFTLEFERKHGI